MTPWLTAYTASVAAVLTVIVAALVLDRFLKWREARTNRAARASRPLVILAAIALQAIPVQAQTPDPRAADTFAGAYFWRGSLWSPGSQRTDYWGGRGIAQVGIGRLGLAGRVDLAGLPGRFDVNNSATFESVEIYFAAHYNVAAAPAGGTFGATVVVGKILALAQPTTKAPTHGATVAAGLRIAGRIQEHAAAAFLLVGSHESIGPCVIVSAHLPMTSRLFVMPDVAFGTHGRSFARINMGVVLAQ